jgi:hypothetical protein
VLVAQIPDVPQAPATRVVGNNVAISWSAPNSQGSPLIRYVIEIEQNDGGFSIEENNCDGNQPDILDARECLVPISILIDSVYQLPWGSEVKAKVSAFNSFGGSEFSEVGGGAFIYTNPDAPVGLAEVIANRTPTSISIVWTAGPANGGTEVLDYRLSFDQGSDDFLVLEEVVNSLTFTATSLQAGTIYKFKLEARNIYGYSAFSETLEVLCAAAPS